MMDLKVEAGGRLLMGFMYGWTSWEKESKWNSV